MNNKLMKRKSRRRALLSVVRTLELIRDTEWEFGCLSVSNSIADGKRIAESDYVVYVLDEAIKTIRNVYDNPKSLY